jgi:cyclophilin family peptidyl-prolyl cis-trans isomerase
VKSQGTYCKVNTDATEVIYQQDRESSHFRSEFQHEAVGVETGSDNTEATSNESTFFIVEEDDAHLDLSYE